MSKRNLIKRMERLLDSTVAAYSPNPGKLRSIVHAECQYVPPVGHQSPGCAIGRLMTKQQKEQCRNMPDVNGLGVLTLSEKAPELLPKRLKGIPTMFGLYLQNLHDLPVNWNKRKGLSKRGRERVKYMRDVLIPQLASEHEVF